MDLELVDELLGLQRGSGPVRARCIPMQPHFGLAPQLGGSRDP
ncbi:MAG: hypothetical protein SCH98_04070 [Deferrisomatales bacterium]|nr:hypothetical protein [Deferrisomatales bacterium]